MSNQSAQNLRDTAFGAMAEVTRARNAVEVGRHFSNQLSPLITCLEADRSLRTLRERLTDQLRSAKLEAEAACYAFCLATHGEWVGVRVRCGRTGQAEGVRWVSAVLWANWQLGEDTPSFYLLDSADSLDAPGDATPCLGASAWNIERMQPEVA